MGTIDSGRRLAAFVAIAAAAFALRASLSLVAQPMSDVPYYDSQAVAALLGGSDPYGHLYTGIPPSLATPGAETVFAYLPGVFLFLVPLSPFDPRLALAVAEFLVAYSIYAIGGKWSLLSSAVFLLLPFGALFVVVYPNNALLGMAFLGLGALSQSKGRHAPAAIFVGLSAACTQFAWLAFPFFAVNWIRERAWTLVAASAVAALAVVLPFLAWNPGAFLQNTLFFEFGRAPFPFVSNQAWGINLNPSLSGISVTLLGAGVPSVVRVLIVLAVLAFVIRKAGGLKSTLLRLGLFLTVSVFVLPGDFFWVYLELPLQAILMSVALDPEKEEPSPLNA